MRTVSALAAVALLSACGGGSTSNKSAAATSSTASSSAAPTAEAAGSPFCKDAANAFTGLSPEFSGGANDLTGLKAVLQKAIAQVKAIHPPAEIAADWTKLTAALDQFGAAYAGLRTEDPASASSFAARNAQVLATLATSEAHIAAYVTKNCGLVVPSGLPTDSAAPTS